MAGANLIYGLGMLESGMTMDYGQLVMDNEIARMIRKTVAGVPVDESTLMADEIDRVGSSGDFLSLESTFAHMHEQSRPELIDRRVRSEWEDSGATTIHERSLAKAREILETHRPLPLPDDAESRFQQIIAAAGRELGVSTTGVAEDG